MIRIRPKALVLFAGLAASCACLVVAASAWAVDTPVAKAAGSLPPGSHIVSLCLFEGDNASDKKRILSRPTIVTLSNQSFQFLMGGSAKADGFDDELDFGTKVSGKVGTPDQSLLPVSFEISVSERVPSAASSTELVRGTVLKVQLKTKLAESHCLSLGNSLWCEFRIDAID